MTLRGLLAVCLLSLLPTVSGAMTVEQAEAELLLRATALSAAGAPGLKGRDGWYFIPPELRAYGVGQFWGSRATEVSRAPKDQDPLPTLIAFHEMLARAGIDLIVVPVPGKVSIYPDMLDPPIEVQGRIDSAYVEFYRELAKAGITVLDLVPDFQQLRQSGTAPFCKQDTHWSPQGLMLAAEQIAGLIKTQPWYATALRHPATLTPKTVEVHGDIVATLLKDLSVPPEPLTLQQVKLAGGWIDSDATSPIVLMGDSDTLVFHRSDLLGEHSGLSDHLAAQLGITPDLVGVMGGGANASRVALARRRDNLAGKKCVVWVFRASEFTETDEGWRPIPVIR